MDKDTIKKYKKQLEQELGEVEKELKTVGRKNPDNPADWEAVPEKMDIMPADDNEVADSIESYEENTAILKQLEIRFNELKNALTRINDGTFGICTVGNETIESDRLDANPASTTCKKHMS
jgi:RNA polymerase-binding transcription factor DksA